MAQTASSSIHFATPGNIVRKVSTFCLYLRIFSSWLPLSLGDEDEDDEGVGLSGSNFLFTPDLKNELILKNSY